MVRKKTPKKASVQVRPARLSDLAPAPYNPRTISEEALAGLRRSVSEFGIVQPIVVNKRTGHIVGGHQRAKVLEAEGVEETDVIEVDLPESREKALNVAMNSPHIAGEFSDDLGALLVQLEADDADLYEALRMSELEPPPVDLVDVVEVDLSEARDEFWISVRGPLPHQADALEILRDALGALPGVDVTFGIVER